MIRFCCNCGLMFEHKFSALRTIRCRECFDAPKAERTRRNKLAIAGAKIVADILNEEGPPADTSWFMQYLEDNRP